jgi:4-amino-4-deoxy-L-arabinose transferase-like glycosyltransferase
MLQFMPVAPLDLLRRDEGARRFLVLLILYLGLHFALRLLSIDALQRDEAAQMLFSQSLALGYDTQPPLYTWLVWSVFQLTGPGILGLGIVKYLLLALSYGALYCSARLVLRDPQLALLAAFSLLLLPTFSWESLRDLTHSVLASSLSAVTFLVVLQLRRHPQLRWYVLLGAFIGLGHLAKYNFALFAAALLLGSLADHTLRARLLDRRLLWAVGAALAVMAPHALWMVQHRELLQTFLSNETHAGVPSSHLRGILQGLANFGLNALAFLTPFWLVWLALFPQSLRRPQNPPLSEDPALLLNFLLAVGAVCVVLIFGFGFKRFQERWFAPLLFILPVYLFARLQQTPKNPQRLRLYGHLLWCAACLVIIGRIGQLWLAPLLDKYPLVRLPSREFALQLQTAGFDNGTIVTSAELLAGNLRLHLPKARVVSLGAKAYTPPQRPATGQCLLVWKITAASQEPPPWLLAEFERRYGKLPATPVVGQVSAPLIGSQDRFQRLGYLRLADGLGDCH